MSEIVISSRIRLQRGERGGVIIFWGRRADRRGRTLEARLRDVILEAGIAPGDIVCGFEASALRLIRLLLVERRI